MNCTDLRNEMLLHTSVRIEGVTRAIFVGRRLFVPHGTLFVEPRRATAIGYALPVSLETRVDSINSETLKGLTFSRIF